jgi:hypothetical protein
LNELEHATFGNARESMKIINEVNKSDVNEIEAGAISQDAAHPAGKRSLKAGVSETPLTLAINEDLVKRLGLRNESNE